MAIRLFLVIKQINETKKKKLTIKIKHLKQSPYCYILIKRLLNLIVGFSLFYLHCNKVKFTQRYNR